MIGAIAHGVSLTDGMGNTLTEDAAADLIASGEVRRHARKVTQVYAGRRAAFARSIAETFGARVDLRLPDGGLAFWLRFRDTADLDRIEAGAAAIGISMASSRSFAQRDGAPRGLRLGFASPTEAESRRALAALAGIGAAAA